jgi:hypothetical protein
MSDTDNEPASRETRSNSKVYHHIPPRIDQEYYQVELPYVYHGPRPVEGSFLSSFLFSFLAQQLWQIGPRELMKFIQLNMMK